VLHSGPDVADNGHGNVHTLFEHLLSTSQGSRCERYEVDLAGNGEGSASG